MENKGSAAFSYFTKRSLFSVANISRFDREYNPDFFPNRTT